MDLIRDILDIDVLDRNRRPMGKIDGIVAELRPGRPPLLKAIEIGPSIKARRLSARLGRIVSKRSAPFRVPWSKIEEIDMDAKLKLDAENTPVLRWEQRLRAILTRIPGA